MSKSDSWENNFKMSDKMVPTRIKGPVLGFCGKTADNMLNFALMVDIVTKKGKHKDLYKKKDDLEDLKKAKFTKRLLISIVKMRQDLSWGLG
jgi:hypothetical protein